MQLDQARVDTPGDRQQDQHAADEDHAVEHEERPRHPPLPGDGGGHAPYAIPEADPQDLAHDEHGSDEPDVHVERVDPRQLDGCRQPEPGHQVEEAGPPGHADEQHQRQAQRANREPVRDGSGPGPRNGGR